ncbi:hypothetical protein [Necropsobacter rosorum]
MSELLTMIHKNATDLYKAELMDKETMQKFDELCLTVTKSNNTKQVN